MTNFLSKLDSSSVRWLVAIIFSAGIIWSAFGTHITEADARRVVKEEISERAFGKTEGLLLTAELGEIKRSLDRLERNLSVMNSQFVERDNRLNDRWNYLIGIAEELPVEGEK